SQYPKLFTSQRPMRENKPTFHPETHQAIKAIIIIKIKGEPGTSPICSSVLKSSSTSSILSLTPSNNHCRLSFKKSRAVSTQSSKGILGINRSSSIYDVTPFPFAFLISSLPERAPMTEPRTINPSSLPSSSTTDNGAQDSASLSNKSFHNTSDDVVGISGVNTSSPFNPSSTAF